MSGRIDAAETALFGSLFAGLAEEMLAALVRAAYSPNIKERRDASTAVFDAAGRLVAQAAAIPVHLGAMPMSVAAALEAFPGWRPGDLVALNDPYAGGTHLPDLTMVSPVFGDGERPVAFLASRAHHADVGGASPGSMPLAREIFEEGLRLPPVRLRSAGDPEDGVWRILLANVRTPDERRGDLRAQAGAHDVGARRYGEALARYGAARLAERVGDLLDYGEALMRGVVGAVPDGDYRFEDALDDDGAGTREIPIRVAIEIDGDRARVDFDGTAPACPGGVNAVEAVTRSATYYAFLCLLATPWRGSEGAPAEPPINAGCYRPIDIRAPAGSVVAAEPPHAVAAGNVETSQRIVDVVLGALARAVPEVVPAASQGTMNNLAIGGRDPVTGAPFAFYETIAGGTGGGPWGPGVDGVHSHMTNTWNTPIEALEFGYPVRVERYAIRRGTGGRGRHPGGDGLVREIRLLAPASGTLVAERRRSGPYGLAGGEPGGVGADAVVRADREERLEAKARLDLAAGDRVRIETPGGGGWGEVEG